MRDKLCRYSNRHKHKHNHSDVSKHQWTTSQIASPKEQKHKRFNDYTQDCFAGIDGGKHLNWTILLKYYVSAYVAMFWLTLVQTGLS